MTVSTNKPGTAPGLVFLAPKAGRGQDGPMIIDNQGHLVWFKPMKGKIAADFRVQTYQGKPVLTWWEGALFVGDGDGVGQVLDTNYKPVTTVRTGNGYTFDLHEFTITPRNTALVLAYERYNRSLKAFGGPADAKIVDNIVQEIDLATGLVLFEWHSFGNVSPEESNIPVPKEKGSEWEYFHANAVDLDADGNFLVSARNTSTVYKINRATGKIMWRLGGKKSDFKLGPGDALRLAALDPRAAGRHVQALRQQRRPAGAQGVARADASSSTCRPRPRRSSAPTSTRASCSPPARATSSACPTATSSSAGARSAGSPSSARPARSCSTGTSPRGNDNYRAFRYEWQGQPATPPKVVATAKSGNITARVSWNGATNVARWELLAGADAATLAPIGSANRAGFETAVTAKSTAALVALRAYDAAGNVLGTSAPVKPSP